MSRSRMTLGVAFCVTLAVRPASAQEGPQPSPPLPGPPFAVAIAEAPAPESERPERERGSEERIETDRDSFTPTTRTAGKNRLIVESAYTFEDHRRAKETHSFPELLLRYGLTERLELRLGWNYEVGGEGSTVSPSGGEGDDFSGPRAAGGPDGTDAASLSREHRLSYGLKTLLTEQDAWVPQSSAILQGSTPTGGEATATQLTATYVVGWELENGWDLDAAIRYATSSEEGDRFGVWAPSVVLRVPVGERVNVHAEYFGLFSRDKAEDFVRHFFSPGVHYLITPDFEVGVRVGWGLNDQSSRFFTNVGLGLRF
jgi:hypothetical protein